MTRGRAPAVPELAELARAALGREPTAREADALAAYLALLLRWNAVYNLTAVRDAGHMRVQHLADCLAVVPPLARWLAARPAPAAPARLLDVGSGAGLPGAVIAIVETGIDVTCVDAVGKKTAFVRQVAGELHLANLHAEHTRVEELAAAPFDVVVSRAFASLADFCAATARHLAPAGVWLAMKGRRPDAELAALPASVDVFHVEPLHVPALDAERCLVWMRPRPLA